MERLESAARRVLPAAASLFLASAAVIAGTVSGEIDGDWGVEDIEEDGAHLLSGFYFEFLPEESCFLFICGVDSDHQLWIVDVEADWRGYPGFQTYYFAYLDAGEDDKYRYAGRFHAQPIHRITPRLKAGDACAPSTAGKVCRLPLEDIDDPLVPPQQRRVFVLAGFQLFFQDDEDHDVSKIRIQKVGDAVEVEFGPRSPNGGSRESFGAAVYYVWVDKTLMRGIGTTSGTTDPGVGSSVLDLPDGDVVLRGFSVEFAGGESHELAKFGILAPGVYADEFSVSFADKDRAEQVHWTVDWAVLGQREIKDTPARNPVIHDGR